MEGGEAFFVAALLPQEITVEVGKAVGGGLDVGDTGLAANGEVLLEDTPFEASGSTGLAANGMVFLVDVLLEALGGDETEDVGFAAAGEVLFVGA